MNLPADGNNIRPLAATPSHGRDALATVARSESLIGVSLTRRGFIKVSATTVAVAAACGSSTTEDGALTEGDAALPDTTSGVDGASVDAFTPDAAPDAPDAPDVRDAREPDAAARCVREDAGIVEPGDAGAEVDFTSLTVDADAFPVGVMGGDALPDAAMAWTRYTGSARVVLRVLEMNGLGGIVRVAHEAPVTPTAAGFAHVDVRGLRPDRPHRFAFLVQEGTKLVARSRMGRFRTAPRAGSCDVLEFGGTSCNVLGGAPFAPLRHAADANLDFFLHCGDHTYADGGDDALTLAQYRAKYNAYWQVPGLLELHASGGLYTTWDDHEVFNNWNPETIDDTQAGRDRLAAARQTFFEYRAFRRHATVPNRLWRSFQWGNTAEVFMLDCRGERRPSTRATADAQFISVAQLEWLKAGLLASTAVFKFIVTSKPITGRSTMDLERSDFWEGYPAQRTKVLRHIVDNKIRGVWFLSGDVHFGAIAKVEASGAFSALREVYMGPAGSGDPGAVDCAPGGQYDATIRRLNYARFRADPFARTLDISFIGSEGNVLCKKTFPA